MSDVNDKKLVIILPSPENAVFISAAEALNKYQISCRNVHIFFLYEYANENNEVAPWQSPYSRSGHFMSYFYNRLDAHLRMPIEQIHFWTIENAASYSKELADEGGADLIDSATGWIGHTAFIDPRTKAFKADNMEEFLQIKAGFVDNHRLTIIRNSGGANALSHTPGYSVLIGPWDIIHAHDHLERHDLQNTGGYASWERMISRLQFYGPVCMEVLASIYQFTKGTIYVSEDMVRPIEPMDLIAM